MNYVKKPVVVQAMQWDGNIESKTEITKTFSDIYSFMSGNSWYILTAEGTMEAAPSDWIIWIIKGIYGECHLCKPDIFELTYEPVEEDVK